MSIDLEYFNEFNIELNKGLKTKFMELILKIPISRISKKIDNPYALSKYFSKIFNPKSIPGRTKLALFGHPYNDKTSMSGPIISVDINSEEIVAQFTKNYRLVWLNTRTLQVFNELFIKYDYFNDQDVFPQTDLAFQDWESITPKILIDLCSKNTTTGNVPNIFYYHTMNYNPDLPTEDNNYIAPPLKFDLANNSVSRISWSLRLLNTLYRKPCLDLVLNNVITPIYFSKKTGMIDLSKLQVNVPYPINKLYNQSDVSGNTYFSTTTAMPTLIVNIYNNRILVPTIVWSENTEMVFSDKNTNFLNPTAIYSLKILKGDISNMLPVVSVGKFAVFSIENTKIGTNYFEDVKAELDFNSKDGNLHTYAIDRNNYNIDGESLSSVKSLDTYPEFSQNITVFKNSINSFNIECSQLILFVLGESTLPLEESVLKDIRSDILDVWVNPFISSSSDFSCTTSVPIACKFDRNNKGCACYDSYVDSDSKYNNKVLKLMEDTSLINTDPWCILPKCADVHAYKNPLEFASSTCSSSCVGGIFIKSDKYSKLDINDVEVVSKCDNNVDDFKCNPKCNNEETCIVDPTNSKKFKCETLSSKKCSLICPKNSTCNIGKNGIEQCVENIYTSNCIQSSDCPNSEHICDTNIELCVPFVESTDNKQLLVLFSSLGVCLIIVAGIYYKNRDKNTSIKLLILSFLLSLIIMSVYKIVKQRKNLFFRGILIFSVILFLATLVYWFYSKITKKDLGEEFILISLMMSLIIPVVYVSLQKSRNTETFDTPDSETCYDDDTQCKSNSKSCRGYSCGCKIGYNDIKDSQCKVDSDIICNTICYLPQSLTSGNYYYSTVINKVLYVFAEDASFKYVKDEWEELERIDTQQGFHPYVSLSPSETLGINSNMCTTYKNKVYVYIPVYTSMSKNETKSYMMVYDSKINSWSTGNVGTEEFSKIGIYNETGTQKDINLKYNNVVGVSVKNVFYIFGGLLMSDVSGRSTINNKIGILDMETNETTSLNSNTILIYHHFSKALVSFDKNKIYLVGVSITGQTDFYIYSYDITLNKFFNMGSMSNVPETIIGGNKGAWTVYSNNSISDSIVLIAGTLTGSQLIDLNVYSVKEDNIVYSKGTFDNLRKDILSELFCNYDNRKMISSSCTYFNINNFMFIISGSGEIFRVNNYVETQSLSLTPCNGISKFRKPLYNKTQVYCKPGYTVGKTEEKGVYACYKNIFGFTTPKGANICAASKPLAICSSGTCSDVNSYTCGNPSLWTPSAKGSCTSDSDGGCYTVCTGSVNVGKTDLAYNYCDQATKKWVECVGGNCYGVGGDFKNLISSESCQSCCRITPNPAENYCEIPI
jgi:hypothetical protein